MYASIMNIEKGLLELWHTHARNTKNLLEYIGNQSNYINSVWFTIKKNQNLCYNNAAGNAPAFNKIGHKKNHVCEIAFRA